jgi:inhibitor of cysteine peptidase
MNIFRGILFLIFLMGVLLPTSGCASGQTQLTMSDNGKAIDVKAGGQIEVELEGNPSTGYTWEAKNLDTRMLKQVGESKFKSSNPGLVGAGGTLTLVFKTLSAGKTNLELVYHRPWEKNVEPLNTYTITITIK